MNKQDVLQMFRDRARTFTTKRGEQLRKYVLVIRQRSCAFILIEQSKLKNSSHSKMAAAGNEVIQVLRQQLPQGKRWYVGIFINGRYYRY